MAKQLFGNNASALLAASISDTDLSIQVTAGFGALFPLPGADEYFLVTLENDSGDIEVVKVTSRSTDLLTIPSGGRGQEGTSAQSWTNGQARVELRLTRGTMEVFLQRDGDAMTGDLNMDENEIQDAHLTGSSTKILAGEIVDVPLRGATGDSSNEVRVPTDGSRATAGGQPILTDANVEQIVTAAFVVGQIIMWYGAAVNIPDGWALCNGSGGTPDLRNRFVVGAGGTYNLSATGGAVSANTNSAGEHTHTIPNAAHVLTKEELPAFNIPLPSGARFVDTAGTHDGIDGGPQAGHRNDGVLSIPFPGGGQPHDHGGGDSGSSGAHAHSVATLPPYYGLFYIMFVGF